MSSPADALRVLLHEPGLVPKPRCFDALSARLVERAGFGASVLAEERYC